MWLRASVSACALLVAARAGATAHESVRLDAVLPPQCGSAEALRAGVNERLGRPALSTAGSYVLRVRVQQGVDGGYAARIELRDPDGAGLGTRLLSDTDRSCSELRQALPLVLALIVDAERDEPRRAVAPLRLPPSRTEASLRSTVAVAALSAVGDLPAPMWGGRLAAELGLRRSPLIGLDLSQRFGAKRSLDGASASFSATSLSLGVAAIDVRPWNGGRVALGPVVELSRVNVAASGLDRASTAARWHGAAGLRLRLDHALGRAFVRVGFDVAAALSRERYLVTDGAAERELFRATPVQGSVELGVGARFD